MSQNKLILILLVIFIYIIHRIYTRDSKKDNKKSLFSQLNISKSDHINEQIKIREKSILKLKKISIK